MREIRLYGSEGGEIEANRSSLPLSRPAILRYLARLQAGPSPIEHPPTKPVPARARQAAASRELDKILGGK